MVLFFFSLAFRCLLLFFFFPLNFFPLTVKNMKDSSLMIMFLYLRMLISQNLLEAAEINLSHGITVYLSLSLYSSS